MGIIRKQAINNSIISYFGVLLGYLNIAIVFPRLLGDELFGFTQVIMSAMMLLSNFGSLGMQQVVLRFFPIFKLHSNENSNPFFSFVLLLAAGGGVLSLLFLYSFSDVIVASYSKNAELFAEYAYFLYFLVPVGIFGISLDSYSQSIYRTEITAVFKEVLVRLLNLIAVLAYAFGFLTILDFIWVFSSIQAIYTLLLFAYLLRLKSFSLNLNFNAIPKTVFIDVMKYAGITIFSTTVSMSGHVETLMLGSLAGLTNAAIFGVASTIGKVINIAGKSLNRIANAVISEAWASHDLKRIESIYVKSAKTNLIIAGLLFVAIIVNVKSLFVILPDGYDAGETALVILAASKVLNLATGMNAGIIQQSRRYRMNLFFNLTALGLTIGLNLFFIPKLGVTGVAIAEIITVLIINILRYLFLKVNYGMDPFGTSNLKIAIMIVGLSSLGYWIEPSFYWWVDIPMRGVLVTSIYVLTIYHMKWSTEFNESVDLVFNRAKKILSNK